MEKRVNTQIEKIECVHMPIQILIKKNSAICRMCNVAYGRGERTEMMGQHLDENYDGHYFLLSSCFFQLFSLLFFLLCSSRLSSSSCLAKKYTSSSQPARGQKIDRCGRQMAEQIGIIKVIFIDFKFNLTSLFLHDVHCDCIQQIDAIKSSFHRDIFDKY